MSGKKVAVIVVHGVADQQPRESAIQVAKMLCDEFTTHDCIIDDDISRNDPVSLDGGEFARKHSVAGGVDYKKKEINTTIRLEGKVGQQPVDFYELYWADLSRPTRGFVGFMLEFLLSVLTLPQIGLQVMRDCKSKRQDRWLHRAIRLQEVIWFLTAWAVPSLLFALLINLVLLSVALYASGNAFIFQPSYLLGLGVALMVAGAAACGYSASSGPKVYLPVAAAILIFLSLFLEYWFKWACSPLVSLFLTTALVLWVSQLWLLNPAQPYLVESGHATPWKLAMYCLPGFSWLCSQVSGKADLLDQVNFFCLSLEFVSIFAIVLIFFGWLLATLSPICYFCRFRDKEVAKCIGEGNTTFWLSWSGIVASTLLLAAIWSVAVPAALSIQTKATWVKKCPDLWSHWTQVTAYLPALDATLEREAWRTYFGSSEDNWKHARFIKSTPVNGKLQVSLWSNESDKKPLDTFTSDELPVAALLDAWRSGKMALAGLVAGTALLTYALFAGLALAPAVMGDFGEGHDAEKSKRGVWLTNAFLWIDRVALLFQFLLWLGLAGCWAMPFYNHWYASKSDLPLPNITPVVLSVIGPALGAGLIAFRSGKADELLKAMFPVQDKVMDVQVHLRELHPKNHGRSRICSRYRQLLTHLENSRKYDGYVIVAHSQGSVITADLFRWVHKPPKDTYLVTMGSPLKQLYARYLPHRYAWLEDDKVTEKMSLRQWVNLYRSGDYVGRRLFDKEPNNQADKQADSFKFTAWKSDAVRMDSCIGDGAHLKYWTREAVAVVDVLKAIIGEIARSRNPGLRARTRLRRWKRQMTGVNVVPDDGNG